MKALSHLESMGLPPPIPRAKRRNDEATAVVAPLPPPFPRARRQYEDTAIVRPLPPPLPPPPPRMPSPSMQVIVEPGLAEVCTTLPPRRLPRAPRATPPPPVDLGLRTKLALVGGGLLVGIVIAAIGFSGSQVTRLPVAPVLTAPARPVEIEALPPPPAPLLEPVEADAPAPSRPPRVRTRSTPAVPSSATRERAPRPTPHPRTR